MFGWVHLQFSQVDAVFTITNTDDGSGNTLATNNVFFDDVAARGNNMRVRVGEGPSSQAVNAFVFITIDFFEAGTTNPFSWDTGEELITQFSDIDSDFGADRSDFAGVHGDDFSATATSDDITPGSSLLEFDNSSLFTDANYSIAHLATPWSGQANVSATDPASQSPVTAAFTDDAKSSIRVVVGQLSNGPGASRHIDIDMTPDFDIVPEPSSFALLAGIAGLGMALTARRRRQ